MKKLKAQIRNWADSVKGGKILLAILSLITLNLIFNPTVAVIFYCAIVTHELGHAWGAWKKGAALKGIYIFPGSGQCSIRIDLLVAERDISFIYIMGPLWGVGFGLAIWAALLFSNNASLAFCVWTITVVNTVSLVPYSNSDGAKIIRAIAVPESSPRMPLDRRDRIKLLSAYLVLLAIITVIARTSLLPQFWQEPQSFFQPFLVNGILKYLAITA